MLIAIFNTRQFLKLKIWATSVGKKEVFAEKRKT